MFNEELHRVSLGQVELSKEQCNRIERLAEVGKASPAEVAEAKARVAQDEMNAVQTDNNYRLALLDLSQLIELETPEGFLLEDPTANIELIPLTPPDEIFQTALGQQSLHTSGTVSPGRKQTQHPHCPKRLLSAIEFQRKSRNELLFDNQPYFQPADE